MASPRRREPHRPWTACRLSLGWSFCGPQRSSALDERTTRHPGYDISQRIRKRVEEIFGWTKTVGNFRRTRYKGQARTELASLFVGAAYNLLRMSRLIARPA